MDVYRPGAKSVTHDAFLDHALHQVAVSDCCSACREPAKARCYTRCYASCCPEPNAQAKCMSWGGWGSVAFFLLGALVGLYTFVNAELSTAHEQLTVPIRGCAAPALPAAPAFTRAACMSSDIVGCVDNKLPLALEFRQQTGLILFTFGVVALTTAVLLLLLAMQLRIRRRQRLAAALLPFYAFYRVDFAWRMCATFPQTGLIGAVYIGYAIWRAVSINFSLLQTGGPSVLLDDKVFFLRNSTCTIADGSSVQLGVLLDLTAARRAVGGDGATGNFFCAGLTTWAVAATVLIPQLQKLLADDSGEDALASVRLKGFVYCTECGEEGSGAGAATARTTSGGGGCVHHAVVLKPGAPCAPSPRPAAQQQPGALPAFNPLRFREVGEKAFAEALWWTLVKEAAGDRPCYALWLPVALRYRYWVWPWPSLQQCSARRLRPPAADRACLCWYCPTERTARESHMKEVGILLATVAGWEEQGGECRCRCWPWAEVRCSRCKCCPKDLSAHNGALVSLATRELGGLRGQSSGEGKELAPTNPVVQERATTPPSQVQESNEPSIFV